MRQFAALRCLSLALLCCIAQASHAQDFVAYEGKNAVQEGEGGTKKSVDGIDMWADGAPPRKFTLMGYINDRRHKSGLIGMISMSSRESDIVALAKKQGADAVILVSEGAETVGFVGANNATTTGNVNTFGNTGTVRAQTWGVQTSAAVQKNNSRYAVVKYLPSVAAAPVAPVAPAASSPDVAATPAEVPK